MLLALHFTPLYGHFKIGQFIKVAFIKTSSHTGTTGLTEAQTRDRIIVQVYMKPKLTTSKLKSLILLYGQY